MHILTKMHPESYAYIGRTVTRKMQSLFQMEASSIPHKRNVAVVAISPNVALDAFCHTLKLAFQAVGVSVQICSSNVGDTTDFSLGGSFKRSFSQRPAFMLQESIVLSKLNDIEDENDVVIYKADPDASSWSNLCMSQADVVLFVANGADRPTMSPLEVELRLANPGVHRELVMLHVVPGWFSPAPPRVVLRQAFFKSINA